jgi:hypothetical protein
MNDEDLQDFSVLMIQEPWAWKQHNALITVPTGHHNWIKITPTIWRDGRWAIRSMMWVNKMLEVEQISVASSDITAVVIKLPDRSILAASVYVEGKNQEALLDAIGKLHQMINATRRKIGTRVDLLIAGDFNRQDQLWGGNDVLWHRQGEADPIIDMISDQSLCTLLPRGTKTWQDGQYESTIDLVLASEELAASTIKCTTHPTQHGSDHQAIETILDVAVPCHATEPRLLFKNAPWSAINQRIEAALCSTTQGGSVQQQTDRLMTIVTEAIGALTPVAKPCSYAKRWWTTDLTQLRRTYTYWRNQARNQRRAGMTAPEAERQAREASKEYYDAIRKQKKGHWDDFLSDHANIWKAAKYLNPRSKDKFDKIPSLRRTDMSSTSSVAEQAEELLGTFFPPLPSIIEDERLRPQRTPLAMPRLTLEEVERRVFAAKSWKAPGADGLPSVVWKNLWPAVKDRILALFQTSIDQGEVPAQWRHAKIIPLKKPDKGDYTLAKAWRPISLLSTLGKILESVIAERISHAVETSGLLPANHFGARKKRSTEQALILLQEQIYNAWRSRKVLSLVSFDVKGAYNGVCKERLLQRLEARGIPQQLVRWVGAFVSARTASVVVNGHTSPTQPLPQAGLPQGSPLSPILFLFFNADLVQRKLNRKGGSIAFVDDYTAWVTGSSAEANLEGIREIVDHALDWEKRSGAAFESEKTTLIHFTRKPERSSTTPIMVKGQLVQPRESTKILGVLMDTELRYREHIARAATKGLKAALALKRLRMITPSTARQLFAATVAPVVDYGSNVWMHACGYRVMPALNRVQRIGGQAIIGSYRSVSTAVAVAEADIRTVRERHQERGLKFWMNLRTLPKTHPLSRIGTTPFKRFTSPLQIIAGMHQDAPVERMETIREYAIAPWDERLPVVIDPDKEKAVEIANNLGGIRVATSSSCRAGMVGVGGVMEDTLDDSIERQPATFSVTIGLRSEQNAYTAELAAIARAMRNIPWHVTNRQILVFTSNQGALKAINNPHHQSGQSDIRQVYEVFRKLRWCNRILMIWVPACPEFRLGRAAKQAAQRATERGEMPEAPPVQAKSTWISRARARRQKDRSTHGEIGKYSRDLDAALPGHHTRALYDALDRREASILAQLRTGMTRLNEYLYRIKAVESNVCACGQAQETIKHFLFRCTQWNQLRREMLEQTETRKSNLSYYLGGKAKSDPRTWRPNIDAVRATIKFVRATKRLDPDLGQTDL